MEIRQFCTVLKTEEVAIQIYHMVLEADTSAIANPGQFVHILPDAKTTYLRRPISIADWNENQLELYFRVVGDGTDILSRTEKGTKLDCLLPLGNGFSVMNTRHPVLIGGGIGVPPLLGLAREYTAAGISPMIALGFNST